MDSKNYLVIGGTSGIGLRTMQLLLDEGHQVWATAHSTPENERHDGIPFTTFHADGELNIPNLPDQLDGVVYAPGTIDLKPFHRINPEDFVADYTTNVLGLIKVIHYALPMLKKSTQASVVMFSTVAVQHGFPFHSKVAASKGAVEGLCRSLAAEYAPAIRFNCIAPSLTDTPLAAGLLNTEAKREANAARNPMKRIGTTDDVANMAVFLLSDKSSWITGQILAVDGGASTLKV
ncbi:MAG: SDR family oxidoreductase [Flavobacteriales bacterium]|nr:SDR family oxidoreductase [Bacteroidota bacterium]MCB9240530.1 SDR family oxidoreductase [Flavobacteriales bacterium]